MTDTDFPLNSKYPLAHHRYFRKIHIIASYERLFWCFVAQKLRISRVILENVFLSKFPGDLEGANPLKIAPK